MTITKGGALVILDGPRGVGKSTMGQELVTRLQGMDITATYFKKGEPDPVNEYLNMKRHIEKFAAMPEQVVVVDRFVVTEWVLATYYERQPPRTLLSECTAVCELLRAHKAIHVVLLADEATLTDRLTRRDTRQWDMHPSSLALWRTAPAILPGVQLWHNQTQAHWQENLDMLTLEVLRQVDTAQFESFVLKLEES